MIPIITSSPLAAVLLGDGFNPSPIFAPLLPAVLTVLGWFGIELLAGIRYLNIFLFGVNIFLTWIIIKQADVSDFFAGFVTLLVLLADVLLEMHGWAMSEALYMTFILAAVLLLFRYLKHPTYVRLIIAAFVVALSCLTRYAALPAVPAFVITLLVYDMHRPLLNRIWRSCVYAATSLIPLGVYLIRNIQVSGLPTHYERFEAPPITLSRFTWYLYNTLSWFIPGRLIRDRELIAGILFSYPPDRCGYRLFEAPPQDNRPNWDDARGDICPDRIYRLEFPDAFSGWRFDRLGS